MVNSDELPHIASTSQSMQLVPRRPDRPKSNYGMRTSRPRSALMGRPKSAGGRLKSKPDPSDTRYGYDMYGQRVRLHKEVNAWASLFKKQTTKFQNKTQSLFRSLHCFGLTLFRRVL